MIDLKTLRKSKGLSQKQLSDLSGIDSGILSKYENQYRTVKRPRLAYMEKLAEVLGVTVADMLNEEKLEKKKPILKNKKCLNQICPLNKKKRCVNPVVLTDRAPCHGSDRISEPQKEFSSWEGKGWFSENGL